MDNSDIRKFNDPVLREKAERVEEITDDMRKLIDEMAERVLKDNQVAGLAAPQVGVGKKIAIVKTDFKKPEVLVLINPKITRKSRETEIGEEGCLSFPGVFLKIRRAKEVEVESTNMEGKTIKIQAEGMKARILQHEIDHLNGVLFFHRLEFLKKIKFMLKNPSLKL